MNRSILCICFTLLALPVSCFAAVGHPTESQVAPAPAGSGDVEIAITDQLSPEQLQAAFHADTNTLDLRGLDGSIFTNPANLKVIMAFINEFKVVNLVIHSQMNEEFMQHLVGIGYMCRTVLKKITIVVSNARDVWLPLLIKALEGIQQYLPTIVKSLGGNIQPNTTFTIQIIEMDESGNVLFERSITYNEGGHSRWWTFFWSGVSFVVSGLCSYGIPALITYLKAQYGSSGSSSCSC
jgi:hypothetical protein